MKLCIIIAVIFTVYIFVSPKPVCTYENDEYYDDDDDENDKTFDEFWEYLKLKEAMKEDHQKISHEILDEIDDVLLQSKSTEPPEVTKSEVRNCNSASCLRRILNKFNHSMTWHTNQNQVADWNYAVNMTPANAKRKTAVEVKYSAWQNGVVMLIDLLKKKNIPNLGNEEKRILKIASITASTFNTTIVKKLSEIENRMASIYSGATIVYNGNKLERGETGVTAFFTKVRNCTALTEVWKAWRDETGKKMRTDFEEMINLLNQGAKFNNYPDYGFFEWFTDFEQPNFTSKVMDLYNQLAPYYKEFHAYVRFKLKQRYPDCVNASGPIPAQLLGNPWAQQFLIFDILKPYPDVHGADVTAALQQDKWTVHKMFKAAEEFFSSIGLFNMTQKFWKYSLLEKPKHRKVDCHGSANDMYSFGDFRIKMCTVLTEEDFKTVHHEMGHITYFMAYEHLFYTFRDGANSGFHEAIGDTIALSAGSNTHLKALKLLEHYKESKKADINTLMNMATKKLAFIPFGLMIDMWRWRVFNGTITPKDYNKGWWKLRRDIQGIDAPVPRNESDFDPGAKYHVSHNVPYIRYFVSFIIQFQFYESMCKASGHKSTEPLFKCDFYKSKDAGKLFKSMLSLGRSKPWPEAMKHMTGQSEMKVDSFIKYFHPLFSWLKEFRKLHGYPIGW